MGSGYGVDDIFVLGQLAWEIYKACKDAPERFKNVSQEVLYLHAVLKEVKETYSDVTLSEAQQARLKIVGDGCRAVLDDLQGILDNYSSLGINPKRTWWDRLGWGSKDIAEIRARLISNTVLLTTFINTSQVVVQQKLNAYRQKFRDGKHKGSIASIQTVDSLSTDERQAWRAIRKELQDIGISVAAFEANKNFIVDWLKTAISTGAFEEQTAEDGSNSVVSEDNLCQCSGYPRYDTATVEPSVDIGHSTIRKPTSVKPQALEASSDLKIPRWSRIIDLIDGLFYAKSYIVPRHPDPFR